MYQKERLDRIIEIVSARGFATIKELMVELHYSNATIHRDIVALAKMKKVKRINGGIEPIKEISVPLPFRYDKMKGAKLSASKKASSFIEDGETIFIDGSTTTQYMSNYLLEKKNIHVITNNISLASFLADNNVDVTVLGGKIIDAPYMTDGLGEFDTLLHTKADKMFFASGGFDIKGNVYSNVFELLYRCMKNNSSKVFYLTDSSKLNAPNSKNIVMTFPEIDYVISDFEFPKETKKKFNKTTFIKI